MQDQYVGDVNDYFKYSLLREIQNHRPGRPVVVVWMLVENDGGNDGKKLSYLDQASDFEEIDPTLFKSLRTLVHERRRTTAAVEEAGLLPRATYVRDLIPKPTDDRMVLMDKLRSVLASDAFVFFDPDNGMEVKSSPRVKKRSPKHLYWDEVVSLTDQGRAVLVYQHFGRRKRDEHVRDLLDRASSVVPSCETLAVRGKHGAFIGVAASQSRDFAAFQGAFEHVASRWGGQVGDR